MKRTIIILLGIMFWFNVSYSQPARTGTGPITSGFAPAFSAVSTQGRINFPEDYFAKWKILFSHPADFTPVCTTEIMALASMQDEFKKLNTALIVISTDGINSHIEWVKSIEEISVEGKAPVKIGFPLVSDADYSISKNYGILQTDSTRQRDIRSVYIIDPENKIRAMFYYPNNVGRNIDEIKRTLIALQTNDKYDVMTPANWKLGEEVLMKSPATLKEAEDLKAKNNPKLKEIAWYLWLKKL